MRNVRTKTWKYISIIALVLMVIISFSACNCEYNSGKIHIDTPEIYEPSEPTEPVEPTEPTEPVEPTEPTEPVEPSEPTEPVEPSEPTEHEITEYKIKMYLFCTIIDDNGAEKEIECTYMGKTQMELDINVTTIACGETYAELADATPPSGNTVGYHEYKFIGWVAKDKNGAEIMVDKETIFSKDVFGNEEEIILSVICSRIFSPSMPL